MGFQTPRFKLHGRLATSNRMHTLPTDRQE